MPKIAVIGGGFAGLSVASILSKNGFQVDLFDKNPQLGGRCHQKSVDGFNFDMGPSWYWMPEVFENYYSLFGRKTDDFYDLVRLDPSYQVYFDDQHIKLPSGQDEVEKLFDSIEQDAGERLSKYLREARYKYNFSMSGLIYYPSLSFFEFLRIPILLKVFKLKIFSSISSFIHSKFKNPNLRRILEFPVLFLGAKPQNTPALYSIMNYADITLGTWYPMGGMIEITKAFETIAKEQGVKIHLNAKIQKINVANGSAIGLVVGNQKVYYDIVVSAADYQHTDSVLLGSDANYGPKYWDKRKLSPSCLLFFIGINKKLPGLEHHNLFFDAPFDKHIHDIYDEPKFPENPLFYVCCPSKTDQSVAPVGCENLFILIPIAPDLKYNNSYQEAVLSNCLQRISNKTGVVIHKENIIVNQSFGVNDFKSTYNSFKGNAYGLSNILSQTAIFKPKIRHKKIKNLYYCGQMSVPGPGVPPSIISGKIVADYIIKHRIE